MQVVDFPALPPSQCFICEHRPTEGVKSIDTGRTFDPAGLTSLNGRKYVCENCVAEMAKLFGFERGDQVEKAKVDAEIAREELSRMQDRARQVAEQILGDLPIEPKVKERSPKAKAAKAKADAAEG